MNTEIKIYSFTVNKEAIIDSIGMYADIQNTSKSSNGDLILIMDGILSDDQIGKISIENELSVEIITMYFWFSKKQHDREQRIGSDSLLSSKPRKLYCEIDGNSHQFSEQTMRSIYNSLWDDAVFLGYGKMV